jgi:PhnB protein
MAKTVRPIPEGYHSITPYLVCDGAAKAIDFYKQAFGATELMRMPGANGKIGHAEIKIGDSHIMLADENPELGAKAPKAYGGSPIGIVLYIENVDRVVSKAASAGAKITRPVKDEFYGDRAGTLVDPFGHTWHIHTHMRDVSPEEMKRAMESMGQPVG